MNKSAAALALVVALSGCTRRAVPRSPANESGQGGLVRVGSVTIGQDDLDLVLSENFDGRTDDQACERALAQLVRRARFVQAALDAGLDRDPVVRAEVGRVLEARLREQRVFPLIRAMDDIPEDRLRERYRAEGARFQSNARRQVAVLWLNPGRDPQREKTYVEKLTHAREWFLNDRELVEHPEKGFSVLSIDHSEHRASRFSNGVVGWLERSGGTDAWRKAVADIAFALEGVGAVSEVVSRPEGVFLVRLMGVRPAVLIPFEDVRAQIETEERRRMRDEQQSLFEKGLEQRYRIENLQPVARGGV